MPLPRPKKGQSKDKWLPSCMGNAKMREEYPDSAQRYAVCNSIWNRRKKSIENGVEVSTDEDIDESQK